MRLRSADLLKAQMGVKRIGLDRLSRSAGCHRSFISHLVSGRRTSCKPLTAERIAEALEVPVEILFDPKVSTGSTSKNNSQGTAA